MSRRDFEQLEGGKFRRKVRRKVAIFVDGVGLDRATRRLNRKVDLSRFMASLNAGLTPEISRYYTLVPYEDDARQLSFLEAVERAGLEVCLKRLPPKTIKRPVSMDVHIGVDMVFFCLGISPTGSREEHEHSVEADAVAHAAVSDSFQSGEERGPNNTASPLIVSSLPEDFLSNQVANDAPNNKASFEAIKEIILVCPNRDLNYAIYQCHNLGARTSIADFGLHGHSEGWRGVDSWIDLSISETIWRD